MCSGPKLRSAGLRNQYDRNAQAQKPTDNEREDDAYRLASDQTARQRNTGYPTSFWCAIRLYTLICTVQMKQVKRTQELGMRPPTPASQRCPPRDTG